MKKTLLILGTILFQLNCFSQPAIQWQTALGGIYNDEASSIKQTKDGGYIVAGSSSFPIGDYPNSDYFIIKLSATGTIQWQKTFGGSPQHDSASSIQETADGGYIVAGFTLSTDGDVTGNHGNGDGWIIKLNATGTIQWQKTLGGSNRDGVGSIQQTTDGGYIVAGYTNSTDGDVTGNHGGDDGWVLKLDTNGTIQWQKTLGGSNSDEVGSIQLTTDGGYIVAGYTFSTDGDVTGNVAGNGWIVKLNATGTIQWQKTLGVNLEVAFSVQQTTDGGYIVVTGWTDYYIGDSRIVKLNATGAIQWQKTFGVSGVDYLSRIQQTTDGGYIVTGVIFSTHNDPNGTYDYWIVKLDVSGTIQWQKTLGSGGDDYASSIQQTSDGGYIVAGSSNSGDILGNHGGYDFWIVKLDAAPLSTSSFQQERIVIYPNPAKSILNLQLPNDVLIDKIIIIDLAGKVIMEQTKNTTQVNTESLASGMYLIQAISGGNKWQSEFIKH